ncbi:hypothetical protein HWV62_11415 [Athelia sp. TMB]|nr:hypothetical protein HWV62_11415 [Athelia sp. TMB]
MYLSPSDKDRLTEQFDFHIGMLEYLKNVDPNVKRGKKSWVAGTKARFLESHNKAWLSVTNQGTEAAGSFYLQVAKLWVKKYGWHFNHEKGLEQDTVDPTLTSLSDPEEPVDDKEAKKCQKYYEEMCTRIRSYYYRANKTVSAVDTAKDIAEILESAAGAKPKPPCRPQILHYYSNMGDFDPFANPYIDVNPLIGLDFVNVDFFGAPENLTLLTEHLHTEQDRWDRSQVETGGERSASSNMCPDIPPTNGNDIIQPFPAPDPVAAYGYPIPSLFSPMKSVANDFTTNSAVNRTSPSRDVFTTGEGMANDLELPLLPLISATNREAEDAPPHSPRLSNNEASTPASVPGRSPSTSSPQPSLTPREAALAPNATHIVFQDDAAQVDISVEFDDCPEALRSLYSPLFDVADKLGPQFRACVGSLLRLKHTAGWTLKDPRLPSAHRPAKYGEWMCYARPSAFAKISAEFGRRLQLWWTSMQLKDRVDANGGLARTSVCAMDWGSLAAPGKSGLFLAVLGLCWWGEWDNGCTQDEWQEVLIDVQWVCEHILRHGGLLEAAVAGPKATKPKCGPTRASKRK